MDKQESLDLQDWVGRAMVATDSIAVQPARFMQATLDRDPNLRDGDPLPPLWHWLYFLEAKPARELGRDAHPKKGGFLPPVPLPRRMWAGGRFEFTAPLIIGEEARKESRILSVAEKQGRSGRLCFVTVEHQIFQRGALVLTEAHDIVYREDPSTTRTRDAKPAPDNARSMLEDEADCRQEITPTEVMLFRYSALTFNGHRIHYDADYARTVEGYDGVVFHGPLTATLMIDLAMRHTGKSPRQFSFRGVAPLSGLAPFTLHGHASPDGPDGLDNMDLTAIRADGAVAMQAQVLFDV